MNQGLPDELLRTLLSLLCGAFASSFILSWALKAVYRRAVEREMGKGKARGASAGEGPSRQPVLPGLRPPEVPFEVVRPGDELPPLSEPALEAYRRAARARRAAAFNYAAAGCLQASVSTLTFFYFVMSPGGEPTPFKFKADVFLVFIWPVAWTFADVVGADWSRRLAGVLVYSGALLLFDPLDGMTAFIWGGYMLLPTLARVGLANQWLKALGTVVMVFTFALSLGYQAAAKVLPRPAGWEFLSDLLVPLLMVGALLFACLNLIFMGWYHRKKYASDQTVLIDTHALLAAEWAVIISIVFTQGARWYAFVPLFIAALGLNWLASYLLFRFLNPVRGGPPGGLSLLLLRVFEPRGLPWWRRRLRRVFRTGERLLEGVGLHWRYAGSIQLITGTDVAAATLEVDELIEFVTGRLDRRVVKDERDLARRLALLDTEPDRDGRFRVNEFVCRDNTWRETVRKLFAGAEAVLVDLRGFAPEQAGDGSPGHVGRQRRGVVYELDQLLNLVPSGKLLLVTDRTTDEGYVRSVLQEGWELMEKDSPNSVPRPSPLRVLEIKRLRPGEVRRVVKLLFEAARRAPGACPEGVR